VEGLPPRVAAYRADFRTQHIAARYSGWRHLALVTLAVSAGIAFCVAKLHELQARELWVLPAAFCFANVIEYLAHRWLMHVPRRGLGALYRRHTGQHHRFFTADAMGTDSIRDFAIILFPPFVVVFFLGLVAGPAALGLARVLGANSGLLFGACALAYFMFYEWMHLAAHLPPTSRLGRLPGVEFVREHHRLHHDPRRMRACNFNITVPLTDTLLSTRVRPGRARG
jgi:hypothetical protein